jgi:hypothetical protein
MIERCNVDTISWLLSDKRLDSRFGRCKMELNFVCNALGVNFDSCVRKDYLYTLKVPSYVSAPHTVTTTVWKVVDATLHKQDNSRKPSHGHDPSLVNITKHVRRPPICQPLLPSSVSPSSDFSRSSNSSTFLFKPYNPTPPDSSSFLYSKGN